MRIVTISIEKREKEVPHVQAVLTKYGEEIHSRIGYHNVEKDNRGLIVILYTGNHPDEFCEELKEKDGVKVNCMEV